MGFEEQIQEQIISNPKDKTFIDKLLGRRDVEQLRQIIRKKEMSREDMHDILYLIVGSEQKLLNYSTYDRYYLTKYFVWVRAFVQLLDNYYDYHDYMKESGMSEETKKLYDQVLDRYKHATKFLVDLYLHLSRSTLSMGGAMVTEALRNKFEIDYKTYAQLQQGDSGKKSQFKWW